MKIQKLGVGGGEGRCRVGGVRVNVIEQLKFLGKFTKKNGGGVGLGGVGLGGVGLVGGGGQGGCERRIKVFVKIDKKKLGGGVGLVGSGWM